MVRDSWRRQTRWVVPQEGSNKTFVMVASHGTTGTRSLSSFLRKRGLKGFHWFPLDVVPQVHLGERSGVLDFLRFTRNMDFGAETPMPEMAPFLLQFWPGAARVVLSWRAFGEWESSRVKNHYPGAAPFCYVLARRYAPPTPTAPGMLPPLFQPMDVVNMLPRAKLGNWQLYASQLLLLECLAWDEVMVVDIFDHKAFCKNGPAELARFVGHPFPTNLLSGSRPKHEFPGCP